MWSIIITLIIILILIFLFVNRFLPNYKEGFQWSEKQKTDFINEQYIDYPNVVYDLDKLQKYTTQEEITYFLENGYWPWSKETIQRYINALKRNPFVRIFFKQGLNHARSIYNEYAILYILDAQEKSNLDLQNPVTRPVIGLPNGYGTFGESSGLL